MIWNWHSDRRVSFRFYITTWLPLCRTSKNPWRASMAQTWRPDKTRNLPNLDLKPGYKDLGVLAALDL
jgi:hypothetical protein